MKMLHFRICDMQAFLKKREMQKFEETASPLDVILFRGALKRVKILKDNNELNLVVKFVATEEPLTTEEPRTSNQGSR